jgi:hypothetical protein
MCALQDEATRAVTPKIMGLFVDRMENIFMRISTNASTEPVLKNLSQMINISRRILEIVQGQIATNNQSQLALANSRYEE